MTNTNNTTAGPRPREALREAVRDAELDPTFAALMEKDITPRTEFIPFMGKEKIRLTPAMVIRFLCKPTKGGYVCTEDQATRFIMLCKARGLNPWEGDAFIVGYDTKNGPEFNLVTAHQAFLKRAEVHPEFDGMESGVVVKHTGTEEVLDIPGDYIPDDCNLVGGWARVHFKNRKVATYRRLDVRTFDSGYSRWEKDKAGMIVKCAESQALRDSFPNTLGGMYMDGEMPTPSVDMAVPATPTNADAPRRMTMQRPVEQAEKQNQTANPTTEQTRNPDDELPPIGQESKESTEAQKVLTPTWKELQQHGITAAVEDAGTVVFDSANRTLTPEGTWDDKFPGYTVQGRSDAVDQKARELAAAALPTATPVKQPDPPKAPPERRPRPSATPPKN